MLLCKDFCNLSSDLPNRDYQRICNFLKDTTEAIREGKTISVTELSHQLTASKQQEHAICKEESSGNDPPDQSFPCGRKFSFSEGEFSSDFEQETKSETLDCQEVKAEDSFDNASEEIVQEENVEQELSLKNGKDANAKETGTHEIIDAGNTGSTDEPSGSFSFMTKLSNQKLEVLKSVQIKRKCKQRGRPSRKRAALSFTSADKGGRKNCKKLKKDEKSDSLGTPKCTAVEQVALSDQQDREKVKCSSSNSLQLIEDGEWLDDQTIKIAMDNLKAYFLH